MLQASNELKLYKFLVTSKKIFAYNYNIEMKKIVVNYLYILFSK